MAKKRIARRLYYHERYVRIDGKLYKEESDDETLFSGRYKTKIKAEDLPEWYVYVDIIKGSVISPQRE